MIDLDLSLAPGCFAGPMLFQAEAKECRTCPFAARCAPAAAEQLVLLRQKLGIKPPRKTKKPAQSADTARPTTDLALPKKVLELMLRVERAGIKVTEALRAGRNPFMKDGVIERQFAFMGWTCHALINLPNGIDRKALEGLLAKKMGWAEGTANAHACQAQQLLEALGVIHTNDNGILKLRA